VREHLRALLLLLFCDHLRREWFASRCPNRRRGQSLRQGVPTSTQHAVAQHRVGQGGVQRSGSQAGDAVEGEGTVGQHGAGYLRIDLSGRGEGCCIVAICNSSTIGLLLVAVHI
jgi:hypothetical protein